MNLQNLQEFYIYADPPLSGLERENRGYPDLEIIAVCLDGQEVPIPRKFDKFETIICGRISLPENVNFLKLRMADKESIAYQSPEEERGYFNPLAPKPDAATLVELQSAIEKSLENSPLDLTELEDEYENDYWGDNDE